MSSATLPPALRRVGHTLAYRRPKGLSEVAIRSLGNSAHPFTQRLLAGAYLCHVGYGVRLLLVTAEKALAKILAEAHTLPEGLIFPKGCGLHPRAGVRQSQGWLTVRMCRLVAAATLLTVLAVSAAGRSILQDSGNVNPTSFAAQTLQQVRRPAP